MTRSWDVAHTEAMIKAFGVRILIYRQQLQAVGPYVSIKTASELIRKRTRSLRCRMER